jgi:glycosyltransferase involved in cell wall biosynthesis
MRVLILNYEFPPLGGGAGNATAELVRALEDEPELEIAVVTSSTRRMRVDQGGFTRNSAIHYLPIGKRRSQIHYQTNRELLTYTVVCHRYLRRLLRRERFDWCLAVMTVPAGVNAWLLRRQMPYLVSLQGSDVPGYTERFRLFYRVLTPMIHRIWRDASSVVANSEGLRTLALRSAPGQPIGVIPNGIDAALFSPAATDMAGRDHGKRIVCVGRLIERKGVRELLEAFSLVTDEMPDAHLDLIGSGKLERFLERKIHARGLAQRVTLHGSVPHDELPHHLQRGSVFVLPSHAEGMSNALLEAMGCGLPVVVTETGGTWELVRGNGIVVPKHEPKALAAALLDLLGDEPRRAEWGRISRQIALTCSWRTMARRYLELCGRPSRDLDAVVGC